METFSNVADKLGIPCAIMLILFIGIWRVSVWIAKNVITPVTEAHISLVKNAETTATNNSATLNKMADVMTEKYKVLTHIVDQNAAAIVIATDTNNKVSAISPKEVERKP